MRELKNERRTLRKLKASPVPKRRIIKIIHRLQEERGKESAQKVFQVLEEWTAKGLILDWEEYRKWGYQDYILHHDGCFTTTDARVIAFQIVSSEINAQEHLKKYPEIPVIRVDAAMSLAELDERMKKIFNNELNGSKNS